MFEDILIHLFKIAILAVTLLSFVFIFYSVYRYLYSQQDQLLPFTVIRDDKADKDLGVHAAEMLRQKIEIVRSISQWAANPVGVTSPLPSPPTPIHQIDLQLTAFGVDIGGLINFVRGSASYRSRVRGILSLRKDNVDLSAFYDERGKTTASNSREAGPPWLIQGTQSMDEALFELGCYITRMHAAQGNQRFRDVSDRDFYQYMLAKRDLQESYEAADLALATKLRNEAEERLRKLVRRDRPVRFADVYTRLGEIYEQQNRIAMAREMYEQSLKLFENQDVGAKLQSLKLETPPTLAAKPGDVDPRSRVRPLRPGISIGGAAGTAATIGIMVKDSQGKRYILGAAHTFAGSDYRLGSKVIQPGPFDGGKLPDDVIGTFAKYLPLEDSTSVANLAGLSELTDQVEFDQTIPGIGPIRGIRKASIGLEVTKLGRTTGITTGKVIRVDTEFVMASPNPNDNGRLIRFHDAIVCTDLSQGGDSGALVVDNEGYAIGIVVAGSTKETIVAPIQRVLDALQVQLGK